ncbi:putative type II secretion system protein F [subsurface metagenome]
MDFEYLAYTKERQLLKGKINAVSEEAAITTLNYSDLRVVTLKTVTPFFNIGWLTAAFTTIKPKEVVMFSKQLALLLESGTDVVAALELLQGQISNRALRTMVNEVITAVRGGAKLSQALSRHPKAFSKLYCRTIAIGEETGNLEQVLRQMADYIEKEALAAKKVKSAMIYPIIVTLLVIMVIAIMVFFVMPNFMGLYGALGAELPMATRALLAVSGFLLSYWWAILLAVLGVAAGLYAYIKTPAGRYRWDSFKLKMPLLGPVTLFSELSRYANTVATLFRAGVPLPEIMTLSIDNTENKVIADALTTVRDEMLKGQGLSRPMSRNPIFPALIVQMAAVGEGTGNLDATMETVAQSYEMEANDRTDALIAAITPATTLIMGGIVAFIALALVSAMYGVFGQMG